MKKTKKLTNPFKIFKLFLAVFFFNISVAQKANLKMEVETGYNLSSNSQVSFWQKSNQYGTQQDAGNKAYMFQQLGIYGNLKNTNFKYEFKASTWFTIEKYNKIVIPELNAKVIFKNLYLSFGKLKEHYGLTDSTTSSGSITFSSNSLPIPQVKIGFNGYNRFLFDFLFIKGHYSHGWFGNQISAENYFLHQKSIGFRIGKETSKFIAFGEVFHNAQWGGLPKYELPKGDSRFINNRFPADLYTYRNIVLPLHNPRKDTASNISAYDYENRFGNHIGQINLGGSIDRPFSKITFYKEILFETGQTFSSLTNIDDGLYGISYVSKLTKPFTKRLSLEYFQTTNQGMYRAGLLRILGIKGKHFGRNRNNYYNHNQYLDGWSYNGNNIGSPFIIPRSELNLSENQDYPGYIFLYNQVKALYVGAENHIWDLRVLTRLSLSKNFGLSDYLLPNKEQFSGNLSCTKTFNNSKSSLSINIGLDRGKLIPNNLASQLVWRRSW